MIKRMAGQPLHRNLPPVVAPDTRLLILGSLPGAASLAARNYYAHPRNQFWRLMSAVAGVELVPLPYQERLEALLANRIGLWDTVAAAQRDGSLDADLRLVQPSDLEALLARLPDLRAIGFNGGTAARIGRRRLGNPQGLSLIDLPSSSPAFTLPFPEKLSRWMLLREHLRE
jgi:double-stranded uracil-DNA glycosylase